MNKQHPFGSRGEGWVITQFGLLAAIALAPAGKALPGFLAPLGWLLGAAGAGVAAVAAKNLGASLTPLPYPRDNAELVENGIYGIVRHPIYTGIILAAFGWSLARRSLVGLVLSQLLAAFFDQKAAREEAWLEQRYPGYGAYKLRVGKLLPLLR